MKHILRTYADLAGLEERLRWALLVGLAIVVSIFEALGALLVYLLLAMVTAAEGALELPVVGDVRAYFPGMEEQTLLLVAAATVAAFFVIRALVVLTKSYVVARVIENAGARLSRRLAGGYLSMPYAFHLRRNSAELIRNAYATAGQISGNVFQPLVNIASETLIAAGIITVLLVTAAIPTLLVIVVLGPAAFLLVKAVYPRLGQLGRENQDLSKAALQSLQQSFGATRDIKVLARERFFEREFGETKQRLARINYIRGPLSQVPGVGIETILVLFISALFAMTIVGEASAAGAVPILGLFAYAAMRLKPSLHQIVSSVNKLRFAAAAIDDVREDLALFQEHVLEDRDPGEPSRLPFVSHLDLVDVSFRYEGTAHDVLKSVTLRINKGEAIGVVGPTGSGKTTLLDVMLGLLDPTQGRVLVDGLDIQLHSAAWRQNLGLVAQDLFLADDTLRRNIAFGLRDAEIDQERVDEAVRLAQLEDVVDRLDDGLETFVGERGVRLSGGQRQRVAIARALYRRPEVLVFDEGTSALDTATEAELMRAIESLRDHTTLVIVAHRLTTVRNADRIVLVDDGRVTTFDSFEDLVVHNNLSPELTR